MTDRSTDEGDEEVAKSKKYVEPDRSTIEEALKSGRVAFVAEAPGGDTAPERDEGPVGGNTGRRFAKLLGVEVDAILDVGGRYNVWGRGDEIERSTGVEWVEVNAFALDRQIVIAMGGNVRAAFGLAKKPYLTAWFVERAAGAFVVGLLPHPSGRNRWYNPGSRRAAAKRFVRDLVTRPDLARVASGEIPIEPRHAGDDVEVFRIDVPKVTT